MNKGRVVVRLAAIVLAWTLAQTVPAWASGSLSFQLPAEQLCAQAVTASAGDFSLTFASPWCAAGTAGGLQAASISFGEALNSQIPQPPEFFGYFREAQANVEVAFPAPPPAGVQIAAATLLHHLLVVWIFEQDGVSIFPIGDLIAYYVPAPPPYLAGTIAGKVRYGEPAQVEVRVTGDSHMLVVRQSQEMLAAVTLKKLFAHPDAMSYAAALQVDGNIDAAALWLFGDGAFRGVKSPAEVIIGSVPAGDERIGRIERAGDEVRVYPPQP